MRHHTGIFNTREGEKKSKKKKRDNRERMCQARPVNDSRERIKEWLQEWETRQKKGDCLGSPSG